MHFLFADVHELSYTLERLPLRFCPVNSCSTCGERFLTEETLGKHTAGLKCRPSTSVIRHEHRLQMAQLHANAELERLRIERDCLRIKMLGKIAQGAQDEGNKTAQLAAQEGNKTAQESNKTAQECNKTAQLVCQELGKASGNAMADPLHQDKLDAQVRE